MSKVVDNYFLEVSIKTNEVCQFFKGKHRHNFKEVILKAFKAEFLSTNEFVHSKIKNEIKLSEKIDHPFLVKLINCLQTKNNMYLVYDYFMEGNLKNHIQRKSRLELLEATVKFRKMLETLLYLKSLGMVHRCIRSSVFLIKNNEVYLGNFFNTVELGSEPIQQSEIWNRKLNYTAPENYFSNNFSYKSDLYSVGVIYYEMLTGSTPNTEEEINNSNGGVSELDFRDIGRQRKWSPELSELLKKLLCQNPDKRFFPEEALKFVDKYFSRLITNENQISNIPIASKENMIFKELYEATIKKVRFLNRFGDLLADLYSDNDLANFLIFFVLKVINMTLTNFIDITHSENGGTTIQSINRNNLSKESLKLEDIIDKLAKNIIIQLSSMQKILTGHVDNFSSKEIKQEINNYNELKFWMQIKMEIVFPLLQKMKTEWEDSNGAKGCEDFIRFYENGMYESIMNF